MLLILELKWNWSNDVIILVNHLFPCEWYFIVQNRYLRVKFAWTFSSLFAVILTDSVVQKLVMWHQNHTHAGLGIVADFYYIYFLKNIFVRHLR